MALDLLELGSIALIGVAILIWGPDKVPEIAKTLSGARRDLESYTRQFQGLSQELSTAAGTGNIDSLMGTLTGIGERVSKDAGRAGGETAAATAEVAESPDKMLLDMAKKLEIPTRGKTREEIQSEIVARASKGQATPVEATQVQTVGDAAPVDQAPAEAPTAEEPTAPAPAAS